MDTRTGDKASLRLHLVWLCQFACFSEIFDCRQCSGEIARPNYEPLNEDNSTALGNNWCRADADTTQMHITFYFLTHSSLMLVRHVSWARLRRRRIPKRKRTWRHDWGWEALISVKPHCVNCESVHVCTKYLVYNLQKNNIYSVHNIMYTIICIILASKTVLCGIESPPTRTQKGPLGQDFSCWLQWCQGLPRVPVLRPRTFSVRSKTDVLHLVHGGFCKGTGKFCYLSHWVCPVRSRCAFLQTRQNDAVELFQRLLALMARLRIPWCSSMPDWTLPMPPVYKY